jgi:hypothetical protein
MRSRSSAAAALTFVLWCPAAASADQDPLETVKSLKCIFPVYATGTWQKAEARAEVKTGKLSVAFDAIDTQDGTAESIGPQGPLHIVVRYAAHTLHFMQVASTSGALYVTTVFPKEIGPGKRLAVHSRHEYTPVSLPGYTSRPEQYYGECDLQP